jgi:hypothetical protein
MKIQIMATTAAASVGLALALWIVPKALAQEWDQVHVNLPYPVTVGEKILPPGDYTIEQAHIQGTNVLQFFADNGMKLETSAMTNDAVYGPNEETTPTQTSIILQHIGDNYYFHKLYIAGDDYGFELPLPARAKEMEKETAQEVTLPANVTTKSQNSGSSTQAADTATSSAAAPAPATGNTAATTTGNTPQPEPAVAPPAPAPAPMEPQTSANTTPDTSQIPDTQAATTPDTGSANREKQPNKMPATSADWLAMLLSGSTLSGAGMLLRRRKP